MSELAFVSVIIPVFNEERFVARCFAEVLAQDYPADRLEVLVADGMSTDRTREIVQAVQSAHPNVRLIDNPNRIVSSGLNRALAAARGEIVVRLDGHCEYPRDYIRRVVELRERLAADSVGGVLEAIGSGYVQRAIAAAYSSPLGLGGGALKSSKSFEMVREVDAVHGGCWRRERLLAVGGFDEEMVRNQDDELSFRLDQVPDGFFRTWRSGCGITCGTAFGSYSSSFCSTGIGKCGWSVNIRGKPVYGILCRAGFVLLVAGGLALAPFWGVARRGVGWLVVGYVVVIAVVAVAQTWWLDRKLAGHRDGGGHDARRLRRRFCVGLDAGLAGAVADGWNF